MDQKELIKQWQADGRHVLVYSPRNSKTRLFLSCPEGVEPDKHRLLDVGGRRVRCDLVSIDGQTVRR